MAVQDLGNMPGTVAQSGSSVAAASDPRHYHPAHSGQPDASEMHLGEAPSQGAPVSGGSVGSNGSSIAAGKFVNLAGAAISLALIAGVGIWGYKLLVRDVTGVPVVRALEGPMRDSPTNPGGQIAIHQGLAVNEVAAAGTAADPLDQVVLAPRDVGLEDEDISTEIVVEAMSNSEAGDATPAEPDLEVAVALEEEITPASDSEPADIAALVEQLTANAVPLSALDESEAIPVVTNLGTSPEASDVIAASIPGVTRSARPIERPARALSAIPAVVNADEAPTETPVALTNQDIPAGTRLVQLGAFDSPEIAAEEWERMGARFSDYMGGKTRVIQQAESGGRTFFRLRAMGFADLSDARRFCSALVAENAACIPVVVR
jgi:hypothetical protein